MSVLHELPTPGFKQAQKKFNQYKYCTKAPFVIHADFESIFKPSNCQVKHTIFIQQHKVCAAAAILNSNFYNFDQRTVMKVRKNALAEFLDALIVWETEIVAILRTNRAMTRLSIRKQEESNNATRCYICRHKFIKRKTKSPKVRNNDHITGWFIIAAHRQCNLERLVSFNILVCFHNFREYNAHLIVLEFAKRHDLVIKVIGQRM